MMDQLQAATVAKENNFISAVVYVHNDENNVAAMLLMLFEQLNENFKMFEIICVDDGSTDRSCSKIRETVAQLHLQRVVISLVHMGYYQGLEAAMRAGSALAIGDFVYEFDDMLLDYEPSLLMQVYREALSGCDVVAAAPQNGRRRTSRIFYRLFNAQFPGGANLRTERFRLVSRRMLNRITGVFASIPYRKAAYISSGLNYTTVEFSAKPQASESKQRDVEQYRQEIAIDALILYTGTAYKFSIIMSILMMCASLASLIYTVIIFATGHPVSGWTTTMLVLSSGLFAIFFILSILLKYMSIMVSLQNKRSGYVVSGVEKL